MRAYKVLYIVKDGENGTRYRSPYCNHYYNKRRMNYPIVGKYFIFLKIEDAQQFMEVHGDNDSKVKTAIFECEVELAGKAPEMIASGNGRCTPQSYAEFWKNDSYYLGDYPCYIESPQGTYFAKSLKIVKKVKDFTQNG